MHYFPGLDEEKILWQITYTNLNMYLATIPTYESEEKEEGDRPAKKGKKTADEEMKEEVAKLFF